MSILTDLAEGKINFHVASQEVGQWAQNLVAHDPTLTAAAGAIVSDLKQAASNAVGLADTALGAFIVPAAKTVEATLDGVLAAATRGASIPFNAFVNDGIDQIAAAIKAEADAWSLKAKAALVPQQNQPAQTSG